LGLAGSGTREGKRSHLQQECCSESGRHRHVNPQRGTAACRCPCEKALPFRQPG
jgi:hypothetical protein